VTKNELLEQAALILEQEGWLICRYARETGSGRMRDFADRYKEWQACLSGSHTPLIR